MRSVNGFKPGKGAKLKRFSVPEAETGFSADLNQKAGAPSPVGQKRGFRVRLRG